MYRTCVLDVLHDAFVKKVNVVYVAVPSEEARIWEYRLLFSLEEPTTLLCLASVKRITLPMIKTLQVYWSLLVILISIPYWNLSNQTILETILDELVNQMLVKTR